MLYARHGVVRDSGNPSVGIASSEFEDAAETQATALGLPEARRVFVPHPIQDANDEEMRAKADDVMAAVVEALTSKT